MPRVSVILPVHNGMPYLPLAVESILGQTFRDFELIITDDASTDATPEYLAGLTDLRVRVIRNERNLGVARTLNKAVSLARGECIARQDADDLAFPHRLHAQVRYLEAHPEVAMVGSSGILMDDRGNSTGMWIYPCDNIAIKWELLFHNCFLHSSVMLRRSVLDKTGCYKVDSRFGHAEDYELWSRINRVARSANMAEPLVKYRLSSTSVSSQNFPEQLHQVKTISQDNMCRLLGWGTIDANCWHGVQKFLYHPLRESLDMTKDEVKRTIDFLMTLHSNFCRVYDVPEGKAKLHRRSIYWPWSRHALALCYRRNGKRDLTCRFALLTSGLKLLVSLSSPLNHA